MPGNPVWCCPTNRDPTHLGNIVLFLRDMETLSNMHRYSLLEGGFRATARGTSGGVRIYRWYALLDFSKLLNMQRYIKNVRGESNFIKTTQTNFVNGSTDLQHPFTCIVAGCTQSVRLFL